MATTTAHVGELPRTSDRPGRSEGRAAQRAARPGTPPGRTSGPLDPRRNSLNLVRLVLALAVLVSHSFPLSGNGDGPRWAGESLGGWAVIGFFAVSGYLITGARLRSDGGRYLINRVARILPGYLACLVVVAFVLAPVVYAVERGGLDGFLTTGNTPLNHVLSNALLHIPDYSVAGTLADAPHPNAWNGSLWSLYYEFLCYIVIGVVALVPVVRRRAWPIVVLFAASVVVHSWMPTVSGYVGGNGEFVLLMKLLPYFLGGAVLFVLKERCPLHWHGAVPALGVALGIVAWQPVWGGQLAAPLFAYVIMWVAAVLPSPRLIGAHDLSYGVYIYAFPVAQLLVAVGGHEYGVLLFTVLTCALTFVMAALSWVLVERPAKDAISSARRPVARETPAQAPADPARFLTPRAGDSH